MDFYAHSGTGPNHFDWQPLAEHLQNVAELARGHAAAASANTGVADAAFVAGLLHDLGKYRKGFQAYLRQSPVSREDRLHKQAGAAKADEWKMAPVAFAIFGHHGGLPDHTDLKAGLKSPAAKCFTEIWPNAAEDCHALAEVTPSVPRLRDAFQADLFTRVLFSCLVDADWTDTGEHERKLKGWPPEPEPPLLVDPKCPDARLERALAYIETRAQGCTEAHIKRLRAEILHACLAKAEESPGLFSLTVPTGGGKTLAGLAFALKHAARHGLRRVVYVAPYMTILEQNVGVFREALGVGPDALDVFAHYSLAEPPGDADMEETARNAAARRAENWDAPVIVTTNVQFFESLFSNKPGQCRKLHNIARSVIILDECQTLPPGLVAPTCGMLKQLASDMGCTIVLCTATQPAFSHEALASDERLDAREIIPDNLDLFGQLKRVHLTWPTRDEEPLTWAEVADRMTAEPSALCIVNTKKAARAIYDELIARGKSGLFHLSTAMCPAHRREKLAVIRERLAHGQPVYLVSTQLIEAGVDVDFPFLMRELAPLESIIQAAGRCNREGRIKEGGRVVVFRSAEGGMPPDQWYSAGRDTLANHFLARGNAPQIDDPGAIRDYFSRLYHSGMLDGKGIRAMRQKFQFKQIDEAYQLIKNPGEPVVASRWASRQDEIATLLDEIRERPRKALLRALAKFQVNLFPHQLLAQFIHREPSGLLVWDGAYNDDVGIVEDLAEGFII